MWHLMQLKESERDMRALGGKYQQQFFALPIPDEIKEIAKNYLYVFPRAHCIEYILIYARLAYYAKTDSRAFSKIVFKAKHPVSLI